MTKYIVRTILGVDADDPLEAADQYKRFLYESDPDDLVYRVQEEETEKMMYVFHTQVMTLEDMTEYIRRINQVDDEGT